jgi:hypothetical protein
MLFNAEKTTIAIRPFGSVNHIKGPLSKPKRFRRNVCHGECAGGDASPNNDQNVKS